MKAVARDTHQQIAPLPLFRELDAAQRQAIAAGTNEIAIARGETLFQKGDPALGFYLVMKGQIKLCFPSRHGADKVVAVIGSGQTFGEAVMFLHQPFPVRAEALSATELLYFGRDMIFKLLAQDTSFAQKLLGGLSWRLHQLVQEVELYSNHSSAQRVIGYLLQLCKEHDGSSAPITLDLPTAKHVVASRLNLTPETFSRILHDLSDDGIIEMQRRRIRIPSMTALRDCQLDTRPH